MLKDLESRHNPALPAGGVLSGNRQTGTNTGKGPLTLILALLVLILALGLAYLLWQQKARPDVATAVPAAPLPAPTPATRPQAATATQQSVVTSPATVVTPRQPPLVAKVQPLRASPVARLSSISPAIIDGSDELRTLTLKGEALNSSQRIVVKSGAQEKTLPADRVEWLDATTARFSLITGNSDALWQVALIRPDGSRSEALRFEVVATAEARGQHRASAENGHMEKIILPPSTTELADRLYQQGYRALQQRNSASAEQLWQKALDTEPGHLKSREGLIALYLSQGRKIESAKLLEEGVRRHPAHAQFALLHARLLAEEGQTAAAITALEQAIGNTEPQPELFALAAALYQQQHDYDHSISSYQRALYMSPQQSHWWMGLGISLEGAGKPAEARSAYTEALQRGALTREAHQYVQTRLQELE
jgi:tetratricopeptide (TPR) repeat protein